MTLIDPTLHRCADAVVAWLDGPERAAGPLTGYRLFSGHAAHAVPDPRAITWPLIQVHVADTAAAGHRRLLGELTRRRIPTAPVRVDGYGVASHLVDAEGRRSWVGPMLGRRLVRAGEPGTSMTTVGLVLRFADAADLERTWAVLDELGDDLYDQQVLDRSVHLPHGLTPPTTTIGVQELHLHGNDGSRLVHLHHGREPSGTAWVPHRPGRFDLGHWIHHSEESPS
ncbi:MAG: hypothetical protein AAGD18_21745 [Actinomycetota bacterium]